MWIIGITKLEKDNELYIFLNMTFSEWIEIFIFKSIKKSDDNIIHDLLISELKIKLIN